MEVTNNTEMTEETSATEISVDTLLNQTEEITYASTVAPADPELLATIQETGMDIVHADLFGAFLICGTLVGIFLLRGRYGN